MVFPKKPSDGLPINPILERTENNIEKLLWTLFLPSVTPKRDGWSLLSALQLVLFEPGDPLLIVGQSHLTNQLEPRG